MGSTSNTLALGRHAPISWIEGIVLTQEQRDAVAERIKNVILDRKKIARERRMLARLRQLQSLDRGHRRNHELSEPC